MTGYTGNTITVPADFSNCTKKVSLLELENYKKTFQSFWVRLAEQFVPATTIFVSGERWCNNDENICTEFDECDFDFEFVEGDVTTIPNTTNPSQSNTRGTGNNILPSSGGGDNKTMEITPLDYHSTKNGPIITPTVVVQPLPQEEGLTKILPITINDFNERKKNKEIFQSKISPTTVIIE